LSPKPERFFFALWPPEGVRAQLARWSRELHAACGGRPVRPENLHLTLAFLGALESARVADAERVAAEVAHRSATLVLDRPGFWKRNRLAFAGASAVPPELEAMVLELRMALARARVAFDAKRFVSHVTLLRDAGEPRAMPELEPIPWDLRGFVLACSSSERGAIRYAVLGSWEP
jgi:RNA 2',3'-cyclic 3'-phosphodiesterase